MSNLMKGVSREHLAQLARDRGLSSGSLSNMIQRQGSFDALMSLDLHSLQSIDNLANLIQSGGSYHHIPESGMKNADFSQMLAARASMGNLGRGDHGNSSHGHMQSLLSNLSGSKLRGDESSASISNLLSSMGNNLNHLGGSTNASTASLLERSGGSSASWHTYCETTRLLACRLCVSAKA